MTARRKSVRPGGKRLTVSNSGLEVWLYDDSRREAIRASGAMDFMGRPGVATRYREVAQAGDVVGYRLEGDEDLDIEVHVGAPLTGKELSVARWLGPQHAFLRLPGGKLCVESNDACRIGPDVPAEKGATLKVPPGDYRLTLYRVDREALERGELTWAGPQEIIVLTPGGTAADAASDLLPVVERRDTSWVGQYRIEGRRAEALVWFGDRWDTFTVNLDPPAAAALQLTPGSFIRTHVPSAGITLLSAFADSWDHARRIVPPAGEIEEYGFGAFVRMSEWEGTEALFCRRQKTATAIQPKHQTVWLPATIEVIPPVKDAAPSHAGRLDPAAPVSAFRFDEGFLGIVLSDVLPEIEDLDEPTMAEVVELLDEKFEAIGLSPLGESAFTLRSGIMTTESIGRLYAGLPDVFGVLLVADGSLEIVFVTETTTGSWIATGLADEMDRRLQGGRPDVELQNMDEGFPALFQAHRAAVKESGAKSAVAPENLEAASDALERFLAAAG